MNEHLTNAHRHGAGQNRGRDSYVVYHDLDGTAELSTALVHTIADATGVDPTDARFRLSEYVDPDALDRLFDGGSGETRGGPVELAFSLWGYRVTVDGTGRIEIVPPNPYPDGPHR